MQVNDILIRWFYKGDNTTCLVLNVKNNTKLAESTITRYHSDIPDKKYARAKAFKQSMLKLTHRNKLPKEERTVIWNTFREKINQPLKSVL